MERINYSSNITVSERYREQAVDGLMKVAHIPPGMEHKVRTTLERVYDGLVRMKNFRNVPTSWPVSAGDLLEQYYFLQTEGPDPIIDLMVLAVNGELEPGRSHITPSSQET
jgi:hypothetical protein